MPKLYFMRHGHAEDGDFAQPDEARRLTPEGKARLKDAAQVLVRLKIAPAFIFSSPRVRAFQTAEIVGAALNLPVTIREEVNFDFNAQYVAQFMAEYPNRDLMFVGHEPSMSEVLRAITGSHVLMKKGSLARVDVINPQAPVGALVWLIAPNVFDALNS